MEKINRASQVINNTIQTIGNMYISRANSNRDIDLLLITLSKCSITVNKLNLNDIEKDIWNCQSRFTNISDTAAFVNSYFNNLFEWKEGINTVEELLKETNNEMQTFKNKAVSAGIPEAYINKVKEQYLDIAIRLLKLKHDYKEVISNFLSKAKANNILQTKKSPNYQFKLDPDKSKTVAQYLNTIIDQGYFLDENPDYPCKKSDILHAIGILFSCNFLEHSNNQNIPLEPTNEKNQSTEASLPENTDQASHTLSEFLLHSKKTKLASKFKEVFTLEKGKSIRLIIKALEENEPPLIAYGNRDFKAIYRAFQETFDRNIGTYQSVKGYTYNELADKEDYEAIQLKLKHILTEITT